MSDMSIPRGARSDIEVRVRKVLSDHAQIGVNGTPLHIDSDLYEAGMTSRASVNVMLGLETEFAIEFPDSMLRRDVFESIEAICEAVEHLSMQRSA